MSEGEGGGPRGSGEDEGSPLADIPIPPSVDAILTPEERDEWRRMVRSARSIDSLNQGVARMMQRVNDRPRTEFGGLSSVQMAELLGSTWGEADSVVRVHALPPAAAGAVPSVHDARLILQLMDETDGTRATGTGNFPRAFVKQWFARALLPDATTRSVLSDRQVVNEEDLQDLHRLRVLLRLQGLIRLRKGRFLVTVLGRTCLGEGEEGKLHRLLFLGVFRRMNLAYLSGIGPEADYIQETAAFSLHRLITSPRQWRSSRQWAGILLHPRVQDLLEEEFHRGQAEAQAAGRGTLWKSPGALQAWLTGRRLLTPLVWLGLLESRKVDSGEAPSFPGHRPTRFEYRTSENLSHLIHFSFGEHD